MNEQEFLEIVSLNAETYTKKALNSWQTDYKIRSGKELKNINLDDVLKVEWVSGGKGGGNCWDQTDHYTISGEIEPEFEALEAVLDAVTPNMSRKDYKLLLSGCKPSLIEYDEYTRREYYGNETEYTQKIVSLRRLWDRLQGLGVA